MFQAVSGGAILLLLSIIAYFLKLLIEDFRQMSTELSRLKESIIRLESEQVLIKSLLEKSRIPLKKMCDH